MKKTKKALLAMFMALVATLSVNSVPASAVTETCSHGNRTFGDKQLSGGVGRYGNYRRYYWVSSNVTGFATPIANAFDYWVNTSTTPGVTTSISIYETATQSSSSIDIYNYTFPTVDGSTVTGLTEFWLYNDNISDPSSQNWGWNKIFLNCTFATNNSYSSNKKTGLVAHEAGHAMGLSHQPTLSSTSIMYNYDSRTLYRPGTVDCNNINHIYG